MVKIISCMSELGAGKRGASLGMEAIRIASFKTSPDFFKKHKVTSVQNVNKLLYTHSENPFGKRIEGIVKMYRRLAAKVAEVLEDEQFPFVVSGDHSSHFYFSFSSFSSLSYSSSSCSSFSVSPIHFLLPFSFC